MIPCPTCVHPQDALHELMQYSDYSMDHLDRAICHPWSSTEPCHWSPFPFTFPVKIAGILPSLGCWRSSCLQGEIHEGEQIMKRHWENREKSEFLKVTQGSECKVLHFLTRRRLIISVQDGSTKWRWFFQGLYSLRNVVIMGQFMWDFKLEGTWRGEETPRSRHCYLPSCLLLIHKDGYAGSMQLLHPFWWHNAGLQIPGGFACPE